MDTFEHVPPWLLHPLPANAQTDDKLHQRIDQLGDKLPHSITDLTKALSAVRMYCEYEAAANRACAHVWRSLEDFYAAGLPTLRSGLLAFASEHMTAQAVARICRHLVKDASVRVRASARKLIKRAGLREVALPLQRQGAWDPSGWTHGIQPQQLSRHRQGQRAQKQRGVPIIANVGKLRELLGIKSARQLGYFLLASDHEDGPYLKFTIPKRDGSEREICAPKGQLRWTQRQILQQILAKVQPHDAAHGFITGRSTVSNAAPHRGAKLLLKFDLKDFFPTIHYYRVVGLFTSLGYYLGNARFQTGDDALEVAPTLARLCCYTPDPRAWGGARVPQGAPTSPAISNLVCRRLDARLHGLAERNQGVYTRYADDLTFSFRDEALNLGRFRWWVDQVCHQEGFFVNQAKFRVIRGSQRQVVTGIVVNDELRIPRDQRRRFRAILHNCRKHGIESQARDHARFRSYLRGFASYIHMVHPEEGTELLAEVDELLGPEIEE